MTKCWCGLSPSVSSDASNPDDQDNMDDIEIPEDKLLCFITGELVEDDEHERNRQHLARELHEEYGYAVEDMDTEVNTEIGSQSGRADLVVFEEGEPHIDENVHIAAEIEPEDTEPDHPNHGVKQTRSYMYMYPAEFGIWFNGVEKFHYHRHDDTIDEINDIPPKGLTIEDIEIPDFGQLRPASELRGEFKRCHNYIAGNQGFQKTEAFHELLKVIFCKVHDEQRQAPRPEFYVTNTERRKHPERCAERIAGDDGLFEEVKDANPQIFQEDETINLKPDVLAFVVSVLQGYSLIQTDTDVKGEAYEEIVGDNLRGDRGEFFTPRNVTRAAVQILFHTVPRDQWDNVKVIDPANGTGGFLIAVLEFLKGEFYKNELQKWGDEDQAEQNAWNRLEQFSQRNLHGIDMNPTLARATKMNIVMHGGSPENIVSENSLDDPERWDDNARDTIETLWADEDDEGYDFLLANPPFGSDIQIDTTRILRQFDIGHNWDNDSYTKRSGIRSSAPPEQLFIERSVKLLKPGGKLAMIIPDNLLTNPGLSYIRYWLMNHAKIVASISLPRETFEPFVGTKSHLVVAERKLEHEVGLDDDYDAFMCRVDHIGHNRRGEPIYVETQEGDRITHEVKRKVMRINNGEKSIDTETVREPVLNDELPAAVDRFKRWWDR